MSALCVVVGGVLAATLPAQTFTLSWQHSVQKTRWEERYRIADDALVREEARVEGSGAGMDPAPDARYGDGTWRWHPDTRLQELTLAASAFTADYTLCAAGRCVGVATITAGRDGAVTLAPCEGRRPSR